MTTFNDNVIQHRMSVNIIDDDLRSVFGSQSPFSGYQNWEVGYLDMCRKVYAGDL